MKEKADKWQMNLVELGYSFEKIVKPLPLDKLNHRPAEGGWSVAEILAHLVAVNTSYFPIFEDIKNGNHKNTWWAKLPWVPKKTGELLLKAMESPKKTGTFGSWYPSKSLYDDRILDDFFDQQHKLSLYIQDMEQVLEKNIIIASPISKWVVYPLPLAIEIIIAHEERHLDQVKRTLKE